ncbi:hypothetical protein J5N97_006460 [Dioscorea zingiberensis]|uniref:26S proteasome regulatory subunit Rpn6 N-terminal domain-containing protein n=1 Tax=Dioscorea zingiberensis TaxID=325984 RepID=A0A9D5DBG5_9LILI|nr:hypothetical protein J5N97_006460 [Dioscorea zingiberensis]
MFACMQVFIGEEKKIRRECSPVQRSPGRLEVHCAPLHCLQCRSGSALCWQSFRTDPAVACGCSAPRGRMERKRKRCWWCSVVPGMPPFYRASGLQAGLRRSLDLALEYPRILGSTIMSSFLPATTDSVALALEAKEPSESISILYRILEDPSSSSEALRIKEQAISNLSDLLRQEKRAEELRSLLTQLRPFFSLIPKAKTAKIVRGIIDAVAKIPGTSELQISLCKEMVEWTRAEKRTFLRQ